MQEIILGKAALERKIEAIKKAENATALFKGVYFHLFGVDPFTLPEGEKVKPWDYQMSQDLAEELIEHSINLDGERHRVAICFLWLDQGPSCRRELPRNVIRIREITRTA